jgi:UDP-N-acetyl-D-galactosamine dehydrogenase
MNELAIIFDKIGIDTTEVLEAAGTKWNFLKFKPGLVGGHCIGVDPYYLTHKADMLGYHPQVILAGRRINDGMGKFIAEQTIKHMIAGGSYIKGAKVNVLGLTFKENCGDLRNSKVIDIINELQELRRGRLRDRPAGRGATRPCTNTACRCCLGRPAARRRHRGGGGAPEFAA